MLHPRALRSRRQRKEGFHFNSAVGLLTPVEERLSERRRYPANVAQRNSGSALADTYVSASAALNAG
jgi:hypothetical protein